MFARHRTAALLDSRRLAAGPSRHQSSGLRKATFPPRRRFRRRQRQGNVLVLTAMLMVVFLLVVGFAIDVGYLALTKTQLQAAADAGALAGASAMYVPMESSESEVYRLPLDVLGARNAAADFVRRNGAEHYRFSGSGGAKLTADENWENESAGDIVVGRLDSPGNGAEQLQTDEDLPNSVQVRARLTAAHANGPVRCLLLSALGYAPVDISATAVATVEYPSLLPMAISQKKWDTLQAGGDGDMYAFRGGKVVEEADGVPELTLFVDHLWSGGKSRPINFAFLHIGSDHQAGDYRRQICAGFAQSELDQYGGSLYSGLKVTGQSKVDTTVDVALNGGYIEERDFDSTLGKARIMPLFSQAAGSADEAEFTLSKFVAMRIMAADLTDELKYLVIQPSEVEREPIHTQLTR